MSKGPRLFKVAPRVGLLDADIYSPLDTAHARDCGGRSEIFSHGGARHEAERLGAEFLGEVPLDLNIREPSDGGAPIAVSDRDNPHALVFRHIAARIWEKVAGAGAERRTPPRVVVE